MGLENAATAEQFGAGDVPAISRDAVLPGQRGVYCDHNILQQYPTAALYCFRLSSKVTDPELTYMG